MSSSKPNRESPASEDLPSAKKSRSEPTPASTKPDRPVRVALNPADCNLDFDIDGNGLQGHALHDQGFAYCWSGARANVGITGGKYCFGCKVVSEQAVDMDDTPSDQQHLCRVGISRGDDPVGNLGETLHSFGFGGTGKFSNAGKYSDYGAKFGVGDTIVCFVNLENRSSATIGFSRNGVCLGVAKHFDASSSGLRLADTQLGDLPWEFAVFPHVLLKNVVVQLQFSSEDGLIPEEGYKPWNCAAEDGNAVIGPSFCGPKECEVLMMTGLPAAGKTTWAEKWVKEHREKRYIILGTNLALDQMKVPGLMRKQNYGERFDRLMERATGIFNTLLARAAKTPRNYILDQTNVYRSARNRKLKAFVNYRKVAVVVFPSPAELKLRAERRFKEMGKEVPADAVNEMLANFVLPMSKDMPGSNEFFDEVMFIELSRGEAQRHLDEMKRALKSPSLSGKTDFSPYSREGSVQSVSRSLAMNKEAMSGFQTNNSRESSIHSFSSPAVGGRKLTFSQAVAPHLSGMNPLHDNATYPHPGNYSNYGMNPYQSNGEPDPYLRNASEKGNYSNYGMNPYQSNGEPDPYSRNASERRFSYIPDTSPYETPRTEGLGRLNFESHSSMGRPTYVCPSDPPSYNSPSAHIFDPRAPQVPQNDVRNADFQSPISMAGPSYGHPSHRTSYSSPSAHLAYQGLRVVDPYATREHPHWQSPHQTTYGSRIATPMPPPVNRPYRPGYY